MDNEQWTMNNGQWTIIFSPQETQRKQGHSGAQQVGDGGFICSAETAAFILAFMEPGEQIGIGPGLRLMLHGQDATSGIGGPCRWKVRQQGLAS